MIFWNFFPSSSSSQQIILIPAETEWSNADFPRWLCFLRQNPNRMIITGEEIGRAVKQMTEKTITAFHQHAPASWNDHIVPYWPHAWCCHTFHSSLDFPSLFHTSFLWFHNDWQIPKIRKMFFFHISPSWEMRSISRGRAIYWIIRNVTSCYRNMWNSF